ncbi:Apelin receptor [Holothuria leucospilota]|uniref:Apelin receptor n=1 Tax=Holothuria leucospilota TaxID=206669 RepID=A0A9Q1CG98_HOLLE|nr:Apelin receptor [Holothuria leucospilota]
MSIDFEMNAVQELHFPSVTPVESFTRNWTDPDILNFPLPKTFQSFLDLTFLIMFVLVGSFGNILVIAVYVKNLRRKQSTANHFLCSLALTDLTVCMALVPTHIYMEVVMMTRQINYLECKITMVFWLQTLLCSSWILVGISVDRYYSLCKPFDMAIQMKLVKRILFCIWLFSVLVALPAMVYYDGPGCSYIPQQGTYLRILLVLWNSTLTLFLPITIIICAYLRIFCLLSKRNRTAKFQLGRGRLMHHTRYVVAKRLLLVICVYMLCWLPRTILELFFAISKHTFSHLNFGVYLFTWIVPYMNSVLNPVLYSMINPSFRKQCWEILTCDCSKTVAYSAESWIQRANGSLKQGSSQKQGGSLKTKSTGLTWV